MKTKNKEKKNYRIFRVEEKEEYLFPKKITMVKIFAKDDKDAFDQLRDYIKIANKQYVYYVEPWSPHVVIRNGKKHVYEDLFEAWADESKEGLWYKNWLDKFSIWCWRYFVDVPKNCWYWCRDLIYLIKNKQQYCAAWCIDSILLDTLKFNIPILKKYKQTLSWKKLEEAYLQLNPKLNKADAKEFFATHFHGYGDDVEKLSVELEYKMFDELIEDIKAYRYYCGDYQFIDKNDKELVETDKKLRNTLPLIKGSYDRYDPIKMQNLVEKHWNRIWETVRKYGQEFNY